MENLILFAWGIIFGIIPCIMWGKIGGDEAFKDGNPLFCRLLKGLHHWHLGVLIMFAGTYLGVPLILGWGLGTAVDDMLFHSFEAYFSRE